MPTITPFSRSSGSTAAMVMAKGSSWVMPSRTWVGEQRRLAQVEAHLDEHRGEAGQRDLVEHAARRRPPRASSSAPWISADSRSRAPAATLAPLRTMTAVTGRPPRKPDTELAAPWASSSRSGGLRRFSGSSRSTACTDSSVSMLATTAMVAAAIHTSGLAMAAKSGRGSAAGQAADSAERAPRRSGWAVRARPGAAQQLGQQAGERHRRPAPARSACSSPSGVCFQP